MLSTDQSHLRKYLATLGVAIVAGVISLSGLFLRVQNDLLVTTTELDKLTPEAQDAIERRQQYLAFGTDALPWFLTLGCVLGAGLAVYGLAGWSRRQAVADELEEIARDRGRTELRQLTDAERVSKLEDEAAVAVAESEQTDSPAAEAGSGSTAGPKNEQPSAEVLVSARRAASNRFLQETMQTELQVANAVEGILGDKYEVLFGVEASRSGTRQAIDLLASPKGGGNKYAFEVKHLRNFGPNYRSALTSGITAVAKGAALIGGTEVIPVVVVVYAESLTDVLRERARREAEALASTFKNPPRVVLLNAEELRRGEMSELAHALRDASA